MVGQLCKSLPHMNRLKPAGQAVCLSDSCMEMTCPKHDLQMIVFISGYYSLNVLQGKIIQRSKAIQGGRLEFGIH